MALAMGGDRRGLYSFNGACGLSDPNREAFAGADLWIVSRVSARDRGGVWGIGDAQGDGQPAAGEVGLSRAARFPSPFRVLFCHSIVSPTACAALPRVAGDLVGTRARGQDGLATVGRMPALRFAICGRRRAGRRFLA